MDESLWLQYIAPEKHSVVQVELTTFALKNIFLNQIKQRQI